MGKRSRAARAAIHIVPEGLRMVINHLHESNSTEEQRGNHSYRTVARLMDDEGVVVSLAYSDCSPKDVPNRARGRAIATGRCLKEYYEAQEIGV